MSNLKFGALALDDIDGLGTRFGQVVREVRERLGWSQERLAGKAGLNRSYMGEVERGAVMPSLATAAKLAQALEIPLSELVLRCEAGADARTVPVGGDC